MKIHQRLFYLLVLLLPTQLGYHFWPDWSMVNGIRIDYLSPTPYLTDIIILGILGLWVLEKITNKFSMFKFLKNHGWLLFIVFYLAVNVFSAQNQPAAFYKLIKIIEFFLLGFYIAKNFLITQFLNYSISVSVVSSSLLAIAQFINQGSIGGFFWWLGERTFNSGTPGIAQAVINGQLILRPYATFPHPNVLAGFLVISLLLLITNSRNLRRSISQEKSLLISGILTISLGTIALVLTFSRVAWLALFLSFVFYLLSKKGSRWQLAFRNYGTIGIIGLMSLISLVWVPIQNESLVYRQDLNLAAVRMWQSSPFWGVGLNNFLVRLPEFYKFPGSTFFLQPCHNIYLLITAETGLIGLISLICFLILTVHHLILNTKYPPAVAFGDSRWRAGLLLTTLFAVLLIGFFDHYFYTLQQGQLLLVLILGLSWSKVKMVKFI